MDLHLPNVPHPVFLRRDTSDVPTFKQVFLNREYALDLGDPKVIVDGGANIGLFAIEMKQRHPDARIICIEPDPDNFALLKKNVEPYPDIACENCGIWHRDALLKVHDKYDYGKWGMVVEEDEQGDVPAMSMASIMQKHGLDHVDVLKLDIETSEKRVFAQNFMNWLPTVRTLVIELHDWMEEGCSRTFFNAVNKAFSRYKYSMSGENTVIENLAPHCLGVIPLSATK
jgi:FkbM family methyltransferase